MSKSRILGIAGTSLLLSLVPTRAFAQGNGLEELLLARPKLLILGISVILALLIAAVLSMQKSTTMTKLDYSIIILSLITGIIHLFIGMTGNLLLLGNALGYLFLVTALVLSSPLIVRYRSYMLPVLAGYSALTFVLYFVMHSIDAFDWLGIFTKAVELALLAALAMAMLQNRKQTTSLPQ